jgi:hypothetical protein
MHRAARGVALCALTALAAVAQEAPLERLEKMEKEIEELKKALKEKDQAKKTDEATLNEKDRGRLNALSRIVNRTKVGGYFDLEFEDYRSQISEFDNHHLILQLSSYIHDRLFFNSEIEYEHAAKELKVEQAYLDFLIHDAINFRGGVIIVPVGKLNILHDSDFRDLTLRPLTESILIPSTWSEVGAGFFGSFFLGPVTLNYETYIVNGLSNNFTANNGTRNARPDLQDDNNSDKSYCARLEAVAFESVLTLGVGGYRGRVDDEPGRDTVFLYSMDVTLAIPLAKPGGWISGPLELRVEAARFTLDETLNDAGLEAPHWGRGAFAQLSFHFFPPFLKDTFLGMGFDNPTFTLVALWDAVELHVPDAAHSNHQRRLAYGLNFRPIEQVVFKFEYVDEDSDEVFGNVERDGFAASLAVGF